MSKKLLIDFNTYRKDSKKRHEIIDIDLPWVEKHRPKKIENLMVDDNVLRKIKEIINSKNTPNMIITGNPGLGKTSTALCIAKQLLGSYYNEGVIELNASDNRGLDVINNTIIHFCKKKLETNERMALHDKTETDNERSILHKIIILDEADNITTKAQNVLANLMETYINTTRFVFTCNDSSKIIESIQSRCMILRYARINNEQMKKKLIEICDIENVEYTNEGLDAVIFSSQGDIRQAINNLEVIHYGYGKIIPENVFKICDQPQPILITNIINACLVGDMLTAVNHAIDLKNKGYCINDMILGMMSLLKEMNLKDDTRIKYIQFVSESYMDINDCVDSDLQLWNCLAKMSDYASG